MADGTQQFWSIRPDAPAGQEVVPPAPGPKEAIEAIGVTLGVESNSEPGSGTGERAHRWYWGLVSADTLRGFLTGLRPWDRRAGMVGPSEEAEQVDFRTYRQNLTLIVNNPRAAEVAFPNPEVRAKALLIVDEFRAFATGRRPEGDQPD